MKTVLIAYHSQTGNTAKLAHSCNQAVDLNLVRVIYKHVSKVDVNDMLIADAYVFATPENFGYMSGELKALFDRTYNAVHEKTAGRGYALLISCGNDGSGAKASIDRILNGYGMKNTDLCVIAKGEVSPKDLKDAANVGEYMTFALDVGVL